jgi:hypothetical protein
MADRSVWTSVGAMQKRLDRSGKCLEVRCQATGERVIMTVVLVVLVAFFGLFITVLARTSQAEQLKDLHLEQQQQQQQQQQQHEHHLQHSEQAYDDEYQACDTIPQQRHSSASSSMVAVLSVIWHYRPKQLLGAVVLLLIGIAAVLLNLPTSTTSLFDRRSNSLVVHNHSLLGSHQVVINDLFDRQPHDNNQASPSSSCNVEVRLEKAEGKVAAVRLVVVGHNGIAVPLSQAFFLDRTALVVLRNEIRAFLATTHIE